MPALQEILNDIPFFTKVDLGKMILLMDLTSLSPNDSETSILELVTTANKGVKGLQPASVCLYTNFALFARKHLAPSIKIAVVSTNFPDGQGLFETHLFDAEALRNMPIDELDIVMSKGSLKSGNYSKIVQELSTIKAATGDKTLKVILETDHLSNDEIKLATQLAIESGADFIKTSTGKNGAGTTHSAVYIICKQLAIHYKSTGKRIGIKPSGGIRTASFAFELMYLTKTLLGEKWLQPELFRFGASILITDVEQQLNNYE